MEPVLTSQAPTDMPMLPISSAVESTPLTSALSGTPMFQDMNPFALTAMDLDAAFGSAVAQTQEEATQKAEQSKVSQAQAEQDRNTLEGELAESVQLTEVCLDWDVNGTGAFGMSHDRKNVA